MHTLTRIAVGGEGRIGSTIYGTILVMAALTAAYAAERHDPAKLVELVVSAVFVFWCAYVYANALSESIERRSRLSPPSIASVASREFGIVLAALAPVIALLLGVVGWIGEKTSIWAAFAVALAMLSIQGYRYARAVRLGGLGTVMVLIVNLVLGITVVAMKVALVH